VELRRRAPGIVVEAQVVMGVMAVLLLRRRIDDPRDMPGFRQDEGLVLRAHLPDAVIARFPRGDVVGLAGDGAKRHVDLQDLSVSPQNSMPSGLAKRLAWQSPRRYSTAIRAGRLVPSPFQ
jgi:hypothetical protein